MGRLGLSPDLVLDGIIRGGLRAWSPLWSLGNAAFPIIGYTVVFTWMNVLGAEPDPAVRALGYLLLPTAEITQAQFKHRR
jgi:hypothetical protein